MSCVMRDEGKRALARHLGEEVGDLELDGRVERARRLVGEEHPRSRSERDRERDPLAHAAAELVRVRLQLGPRPLESHACQERPGGLVAVVLALDTAAGERPPELAADAEGGVEGRAGVLEDARDLAPEHAPAGRRGCIEGGTAVLDAPGDDRSAGSDPEDRAGRHRLAAPRLADQPEHASGRRLEARRRRRGCRPGPSPSRSSTRSPLTRRTGPTSLIRGPGRCAPGSRPRSGRTRPR